MLSAQVCQHTNKNVLYIMISAAWLGGKVNPDSRYWHVRVARIWEILTRFQYIHLPHAARIHLPQVQPYCVALAHTFITLSPHCFLEQQRVKPDHIWVTPILLQYIHLPCCPYYTLSHGVYDGDAANRLHITLTHHSGHWDFLFSMVTNRSVVTHLSHYRPRHHTLSTQRVDSNR